VARADNAYRDTRPATVAVMDVDHAELLDDAERTLDEVDRALAALDDGSFDVCAECNERIEPDALVAEPTVRVCAACRETSTREATGAGPLDATQA
jgi:DnaK suppressor protein